MGILAVPIAQAAEDAIIFYPGNKELSVAGKCAKPQVLILIYYAGSDKVWGSGNARCESGQYQYKQDLSSWDIADGEFEVEVIDGGYKEKLAREKQGKAQGKKEKVIISGMEEYKLNQRNLEKRNLTASGSIGSLASNGSDAVSIDSSTSSPGAADRDEAVRLLDNILNKVFNIVRDVKEAVQNFIVIIAKTIQTATLAAVEIFTGTLAILPDGGISVPEGENQVAGSGVIAAGAKELFIANTQITENSKIFLTSLSEASGALVVSEKISKKGFKVSVSKLAENNITFDWLIIDAYNASEASVSASAKPSISTSTAQNVLASVQSFLSQVLSSNNAESQPAPSSAVSQSTEQVDENSNSPAPASEAVSTSTLSEVLDLLAEQTDTISTSSPASSTSTAQRVEPLNENIESAASSTLPAIQDAPSSTIINSDDFTETPTPPAPAEEPAIIIEEPATSTPI